MTDAVTTEADWHNDGHRVSLRLDGSGVGVNLIFCPGGRKTGLCQHRTGRCVVDWFVSTYGLECNVGQAAARPELEIAWTLLGDDLELESCQLWFLPVDDPAFASWVAVQS